jgi:hypothetical protein
MSDRWRLHSHADDHIGISRGAVDELRGIRVCDPDGGTTGIEGIRGSRDCSEIGGIAGTQVGQRKRAQ